MGPAGEVGLAEEMKETHLTEEAHFTVEAPDAAPPAAAGLASATEAEVAALAAAQELLDGLEAERRGAVEKRERKKAMKLRRKLGSSSRAD